MTSTSTTSNDPLSIHRRAIVVDMHADTTQRLVDEGVDLDRRLADGHLDAVRAKEGGLDAQFFSIWVEPELFGLGGPRAMKRADLQIEAVRALDVGVGDDRSRYSPHRCGRKDRGADGARRRLRNRRED